MSNQIPTGFSEEFTREVKLLLQQEDSRFGAAVERRSFTGKDAKAVEQIGSVVAQKRTTRHGDTPLISTPHDARWVYPVDYEFADLIDKQDELRAIASFEGPYARNAANAMRRAQDDEIIASFFSDTTKTGEDAGTTTDWTTFVSSNADHQIASSSVGLSVSKLRSARKALRQAEGGENASLYVGISAEQEDDLLGETLAVSMDYQTKPILENGHITSFMGFNFIHSERLGVDGSADRRCPAWDRTGMLLGVWKDVMGRVSERGDKSYATQIYSCTTIGATRLEEKKLVEILCSE